MSNDQPLIPGMENYMELNMRFANPVPHLAEGASRWAEKLGKTHNADQFKGIGVGRGYHALAPIVSEQIKANPQGTSAMTPELSASYDALRNETRQQFAYLTGAKEHGGLGVSVEVSPTNPYETPKDLHKDVMENNRLKVLSTESTGGHAILSNEENDMFRAVHDAFGHLAIGRDFSRHGEEAAYKSHSKMFSDKAIPALVSETRAQNSYLINTGKFTPQMPFDIPKWANNLEGAPRAPKQREQRPVQQPKLF